MNQEENMIRLAKYVENELYENSILFAEAEARLMASCSYIDFILKDFIEL